MATRTVPFCLEMLTFGHPESSGALWDVRWTRGGPMATRTVPFCLEMLAFGHPESSWHTREGRGRGEGLWPLAQCLFAWKCLHLATQRAPGTLA